MTIGRYLRGVALIVCLSIPIRSAWAGDAVVLIEAGPSDSQLTAVLVRLRAELESVDFKVLVSESVDLEPELEHDPGTRVVAIVVVRRDDDGRSLDITVTNRLSGAMLSRRVDAARSGDKASSIIALKTTEAVRASLAELTILPPIQTNVEGPKAPPIPSSSPPPPVPQEILPPPSGIGVSLGAAALALAIPGGAVALAETIRVSEEFHDGLAIRLSLVTQAPSLHFSTATGTASLRGEVGTLEAVVRVASAQRTWLSLSGGAGVHAFQIEGQSSIPNQRPLTESRWVPLFTAGLSGGWSLAPRVALVVDVQGMLSVTRSDVVIVDDEVSHIGPVMLLAGMGLLFRP